MEKPTEPKKSKVGRPRKADEFTALISILDALKLLDKSQCERVMSTANAWLSANKTEGVNLE